MKSKKLLAAIVAGAIAVSSFACAFAGTFPDVTARHSWAEPYIENMVSRGLLKGYTDGSFKPDNVITKMETIILASRILGVEYDENADFVKAALDEYSDFLAAYDTQYKKEAAYLLYWGALTKEEIASYISENVKNTAMSREDVAVLLTKVMGGDKEANENDLVILNFADDDDISAVAKAYVNYVFEKGIMNGMENNTFQPEVGVTRAMMATMMCRVEDAMEMSVEIATVDEVEDASIVATTSAGKEKSYTLFDDVIINVDGEKVDIDELEEGMKVRIHKQGKEIRLVEALSSQTQKKVSGVIYSLTTTGGANAVQISPTGAVGEAIESYTFAEDYVLLINNTDSYFSVLQKGYYIELEIEGGLVVRGVVTNKTEKFNGTFVSLDKTNTLPIFTIKLSNGQTKEFTCAENLTVKRNGAAALVIDLLAGDIVDLTSTAGRVTAITATSKTSAKEGTIEEVVISATPKITINNGAKKVTYAVSTSTIVKVGGADATVYDLRVGQKVDLSLEGNTVTKITAIANQATATSQIIGTVTLVNPSYSIIGVQPADGSPVVQTVVKSTAKIIDNTSTRVTSLKGLEPGRAVILLGSLDSYGTYSVNTVIITQ